MNSKVAVSRRRIATRGLHSLIAIVVVAAGIGAIPAREAAAGGLVIHIGNGGHSYDGHAYRGRHFSRYRHSHRHFHTHYGAHRNFSHYLRPHGLGRYARIRHAKLWRTCRYLGQRHDYAQRYSMLDGYDDLPPIVHEVRKAPYAESPNDVVRRYEEIPVEPQRWAQYDDRDPD